MFMNPEISLRCQQKLKHVPILSQMNRVLTFPTYFSKFHFDTILPSIPKFFKLSHLQFFSNIFFGFLFFVIV